MRSSSSQSFARPRGFRKGGGEEAWEIQTLRKSPAWKSYSQSRGKVMGKNGAKQTEGMKWCFIAWGFQASRGGGIGEQKELRSKIEIHT